jgi:hypothetical protein
VAASRREHVGSSEGTRCGELRMEAVCKRVHVGSRVNQARVR